MTNHGEGGRTFRIKSYYDYDTVESIYLLDTKTT